jgi:hypothetical protein
MRAWIEPRVAVPGTIHDIYIGRSAKSESCRRLRSFPIPVNIGVSWSMHRSHVIPRARILFIDDEPQVLTGIERHLRRDRERWEMVFAVGGLRGLDEIRNRCFTTHAPS